MKAISTWSFLRVRSCECVRECVYVHDKGRKLPYFLRTLLYPCTRSHNHFDKSPYNFKTKFYALNIFDDFSSFFKSLRKMSYGEKLPSIQAIFYGLIVAGIGVVAVGLLFLLLLEMQWNENYINSIRSKKWRS